MTAYVGYKNAFEQAGVTITTENITEVTGFEVANCYDYKTHTSMKTNPAAGAERLKVDAGSGNTIEADYFGYVGHNFSTDTSGTGSVSLEYSSDDVSYTTLASHTPTDDGVQFVRASSPVTARYWRITLGMGTGHYLSHIQFGKALQLRPLNKGFRPPVSELYQAVNAAGGDANFLGRTVKRKPQDLQIRQAAINPADYRTDFKPFVDHALRKPFFFSWDYESYPGEAVYCWLDKKAPEPVYSHLCHMALDLRVQAIKS